MTTSILESLLCGLLEQALHKTYHLSQANISPLKSALLEFPKEKAYGDLSTPIALKLASLVKQNPREIANRLIASLNEEIPKSKLNGFIEKIDCAGAGFINFTFKTDFFYSLLVDIIETNGRWESRPEKEKKVLVEFVSANPTGPLSVAHGRQAAVGDALCNVLEFLGYKVQREYYLNDEGNQINILGNSIYLRLKELRGEHIEFPEDHYQGEYIYDLAKELLELRLSDDTLSEQARVHGVKRILEIIKKELSDFGVRFNSWYSQKALGESGKIQETIAFLKKKGLIYEEEGAVWFASTKFGDDKDRVIIKADGAYTYLTPDIAYHQDKFKRGFDWLINLWGPDHHGYINRLKASVEALGQDRKSLDIIIVQLATLFKAGKVVSMSTRRGEYVTLREVMDEVGPDAARFFFMMRKTDSHLDFDLELAKSKTAENPVYYVQYAHARIANILVNADLPAAKIKKADLSLLKEGEELSLLRELARFEYALRVTEMQLDPYSLASYLQELAESFHRFYDTQRVLVEDEDLKKSRLALILGCKIVLAQGLKLLGINAPEKM